MTDCFMKTKCPLYAKGNCKGQEDLEFCQKYVRVRSLFLNAQLVPKQMLPTTTIGWKADTEEEKESYVQLKEYAKASYDHVINGDNLYIYSHTTGTGKTQWSLAILRSYIMSIWAKISADTCPALFIHVPTYFIMLKNSFNTKDERIEYINEHIREADLVVFDEVGAKAPTTFEEEQLLSIINERMFRGKANVYTSNLNPDELKNNVNARLGSRIIEGAYLVEVKSRDRRGLTMREKGAVKNG